MGTYLPGMESHNAVNNDDGFSTGFIAKKTTSRVNQVPPQGYMQQQYPNNQQMPIQNNQVAPMQNTQAMPVQNMQRMPMQNTQAMPVQNMQKMPMQNTKPPVSNMPKMPIMNQGGSNTFKNKSPFPKKVVNTNGNISHATGAVISEDKNKTASKVIYVVSILIMVSMIVFVALYMSGKINLKKEVEDPHSDPEPIVDPEKEKIENLLVKLNGACNNLDDNGNYGSPTVQAEEECTDLICFIEENVMCQDKLCMIVSENKVYTRDCYTGVNKVGNKYDFQANVNLGDACNTVLSNPALNGSIEASYATCVYYECVTTIDGKLYQRNCKESG